MCIASALHAQTPTPAGTQITNTVTGSYYLGGNVVTADPATVAFVVAQSHGVTIQSSQQKSALPNSSVTLTHTVTNRSNAAETFVISGTTTSGWDVAIYKDANGDGVGDAFVTGGIEIPAGGTVAIVAVVHVPAGLAADHHETIRISAQSAAVPAVIATVQDIISTPSASLAPQLTISKEADVYTRAGDIITYRIDYSVGASGGAALDLTVSDALPSGVKPVMNSIIVGDKHYTGEDDADQAEFTNGGRRLVVHLGNAAPGASGTIQFQVTSNADVAVGSDIINQAQIFSGKTPNAVVSSEPARTRVLPPLTYMHIRKSVSSAQALPGQELTYSIAYAVSGAEASASLQHVVISDLVPAGTNYVPGTMRLNGAAVTDSNDSDSGDFDAAGNGSIAFRFDTLASSASGTVQFTVRVNDAADAGTRIANTAVVSYGNHDQDHIVESSNTVVTTTEAQKAGLEISKSVDAAIAENGQELTYTLAYRVVGKGMLNNVDISDVIPAGTEYIEGSLSVAGSYDAAARRIAARFSSLAAGASGAVQFRVRVVGAANGQVLLNTASAQYENRDTTYSTGTNTTTTTVRQAEFSVSKSVIGRTTAWYGDTVGYRIVARNAGRYVSVRGMQLADTLPEQLELLSATPAAGIDGRTLTWSVPDLAVGDSAVYMVRARVAAHVEQLTTVTNTVHASVAERRDSASASLQIQTGSELQLEIKLSSDVLEVAPGDVAPLIADVHNPGYATLHDVVIDLVLPEGTRFVPGTLRGADSVLVQTSRTGAIHLPAGAQASLVSMDSVAQMNGPRLRVRLPNDLGVGETVRIRYSIAIVAPRTKQLQNAAIATAQNQTVFSNLTLLPLQTKGSASLTLTVIGKVFVDANGNGKQDDGEAPVAGVDVWTEDGSVSRTDTQGKFSFVNLQQGMHAFRADPATVPAALTTPSGDDGIVRVRVTGWTSPRVSLPLVANTAPVPIRNPQPVSADTPVSRDTSDVVMVKPARSDAERSADKARDFLVGPAPQIFGVADGRVIGEKRTFVGVRAEPNVKVALFRGDTLIEEGTTRVDGVYDFMGVPLRVGPNMLRARVTNSWEKVRWDSVMVHYSGEPAKLIAIADSVVVPADGSTTVRVRVRVLDKWNVPVTTRPYLEVNTDGLSIVTPDAYPTAAGHQIQPDANGWAVVELKAGLKVTTGFVSLSSRGVIVRLRAKLVAPAMPFMLIGTGEIGVGATASSFVAITGRGSIDRNTAVTISVDSRRVQNGDAAFGRSVDPMAEGQYPIIGDASNRRAMSAARAKVSARIERGLDYLAFGDVRTNNVGSDASLTQYSRSITGAAAQVTTGAMTWSGFGALSSQALQQVQLRGRGVSGPYQIDRAIIPGTDQVRVEVRDKDNAQRVIAKDRLLPFMDYDIDYATGAILLKKPLPSMDASGNPIFLVVTAETVGSGDKRLVVGGHLSTDISALTGSSSKGLQLGGTLVRDGQSLNAVTLSGVDLSYAPKKNIDIHAEIAHSQNADSSGFAGKVEGQVLLAKDRVTLAGRFAQNGAGFGNPSAVAMQAVAQDLSLSAAVKVLGSQVRLEHARQEFREQGISRSRTSLSVNQQLLRNASFEAKLVDDAASSPASEHETGAGEFKLTWNPTKSIKLWGESRNELSGSNVASTGNYVGAGAALQIMQGVWLEGQHRSMSVANKPGYTVTNFGVRSTMAAGSQAFGSYQIVGGVDGASNAAVVGLNNRWQVGPSWRLNTMFERRMGVAHARPDDPIRAQPFPQAETDYWSGGVGVEFVPESRPYRFSAKAEQKSGVGESLKSAIASGDVALSNGLAILSRQEYTHRVNGASPLAGAENAAAAQEHVASIIGLALRPANADNLNGLMELRWASDRNPNTGGQFTNRNGLTQRVVGSAELIWSPTSRLEIDGRVAVRAARNELASVGLPTVMTRSRALFYGSRADIRLTRFASLRAEGRMIDEQLTNSRVWDLAPSVVLHPVQGIELTAGRRVGDMRDIDFAVNGGAGWFFNMGFRFTEKTLPTAAAFWRDRFGR